MEENSNLVYCVDDDIAIRELYGCAFALGGFLYRALASGNELFAELNKRKPDLIVLTGDNVLMATKDTVIKQVAFLDSLDVPYTFTFGNHDYQGLYSIDWLLNTLENGKNSLFVYQKDDIDGDGNQLVTFTNGGKALWEVYMVDTNSYRETGSTYDYSTIQENQVEWMKEEKALSKEKYGEIQTVHWL